METIPTRNRSPKFVRWAVLIAIVIALNIFLQVGRSLILPEPQYATYCPASSAPAPASEQACTSVGGTWNPPVPAPDTNIKTAPVGYCDVYTKCQKAYDDADHQYALYAFIFGISFGVLAIIVGVLPLGSSIVSAGLTYGGVLSFIIAAAQYWTDAGNVLRFGISFIALAALIYIGLKRFRD